MDNGDSGIHIHGSSMKGTPSLGTPPVQLWICGPPCLTMRSIPPSRRGPLPTVFNPLLSHPPLWCQTSLCCAVLCCVVLCCVQVRLLGESYNYMLLDSRWVQPAEATTHNLLTNLTHAS